MPAFLWSGNQSATGTTAELYRVYVFTDSQCLNQVYQSSVVGGPAWAPRLTGPLALPTSDPALTAARGSYLGDGKESNNLTYDFRVGQPNEQLAPATPTTTVPGEVPSATGTTPPPSQNAGPGGAAAGAAGSGSSAIGVSGNVGPPVDLWDVDWPRSGYYWTVVPVAILGASGGATVSAPGTIVGSTTLPVNSTTGFRVGDAVSIGAAPSVDSAIVSGVSAGTLTFSTPMLYAHTAGQTVTRAGGSLVYQDLELPQDVCTNPDRIQRFGISSEPSLTTAQSPFATGLSATGRLVSAAKTPAFYGQPLVAWTPAIGASIYQIQWSKVKYPFVAEADPAGGGKGRLTFSTSTVLPLKPGTWYYRVRGFNYNLPTGVQQMGWSDAEKLVVTSPTYKLAPAPKKKFKVVGKP
jgi:hypothetical protein